MKRYLFLIQAYISLLSTVHATKEPEIESCSYVDMYAADCRWRKPNNNKSYDLYFIYGSDRYHRKHKCEPTKEFRSKDGVVYQHCQFKEVLYKRMKFFLAADCKKSEEETEYFSCEQNSYKNITFECDEKALRLLSPPTRFERLQSSTFVWENPEKEGSQLDFFFFLNSVSYKLVYKIDSCDHYIPAETVDFGEWKVWYYGPSSRYTPYLLKPGCNYSVRVYASIRDEEWSNPSNIISFKAPGEQEANPVTVYSTSVITTTTEIRVTRNEKPPANLVIYVLATFLFVVVSIIIGLQICCCVFPEKFKIPKPIIMVSMDDSKDDWKFERKMFEKNPLNLIENPTPLYDCGPSVSSKSSGNKAEFKQNRRISLLLKVVPNIICNETWTIEYCGQKKLNNFAKNLSLPDLTKLDKNQPVGNWYNSEENKKSVLVGLEVAMPSINKTPHLTPREVRKKAVSNQYVENIPKNNKNKLNFEEENISLFSDLTKTSDSLESVSYVVDSPILSDEKIKNKMEALKAIQLMHTEEPVAEYVRETKLSNCYNEIENQKPVTVAEAEYMVCGECAGGKVKQLRQEMRVSTVWKCSLCRKLISPETNSKRFDEESFTKENLFIPSCVNGLNVSSTLTHLNQGLCMDSITSI